MQYFISNHNPLNKETERPYNRRLCNDDNNPHEKPFLFPRLLYVGDAI